MLAGLAVLIPLLPVGCGDSPAASEGDGAFRVAVVVPGSTADQGWNFSAREGARRIEQELDLTHPVSFLENVEASRRKPALRDYARQGYRLVICHGYEFHQMVKEIAGDFPATTFIVSGYDQPDERFGSIVYQLGEAAYLCGAIAAQVSHTGHVGFIAAQQVPPVVLCYKGFRNGFLHHRPDGSVREPVYIEGARPWEDAAAAKAKTQAMLRVDRPLPMDVLFQNADAASRGIFEAVESHAEPVFVFGANRDQNATTATSRVLASAIIRVDEAFLRVAREVRDGTFRPGVRSETLGTGIIDCVINPRLAELVGDDRAHAAHAALEQARTAILSGEIDPYAE